MRSIQSVCSKDHSPEEIAAWGGRKFENFRWAETVTIHHVWVVEVENKIEGYGHLNISEGIEGVEGYVEGLYLTPKCIGKKIGLQMINLILDEAKKNNLQRLRLHSTLTAHDFYQKIGFGDEGPMIKVKIAGEPIRCYPMTILL